FASDGACGCVVGIRFREKDQLVGVAARELLSHTLGTTQAISKATSRKMDIDSPATMSRMRRSASVFGGPMSRM
ncbi:hypothetical protein M5D96_001658, partial [Drosophila gunungcola]